MSRAGSSRRYTLAVTALIVVAASAVILTNRSCQPGQGARVPLPSRGGATDASRHHPVLVYFESRLDTLAGAIDTLDAALAGTDEPRIHAAFRRARADYKGIEGLVELYAPGTSEALNGPLSEEDDDAPARPLGEPAGFQVVEGAIFPHVDRAAIAESRAETKRMAQNVRHLRQLCPYLVITPLQLFEAGRLEIARVTTLGLAGFDSDVSGDATADGANALAGIRAMFALARRTTRDVRAASWAAIDTTLARASQFLRDAPNSDSLDRITFIVNYSGPAARAIAAARREVRAPELVIKRVWRLDAPSVFDSGALDPQAYATDDAPPPSAALIALGQRLFVEPSISGPGTRSCQSCHDPARAFTDGRARSASLIPAAQATARNTPTLINAGYSPVLFWDERATSLEGQVGAVLSSPAEMASSPELAASRLKAQPAYRAAFAKVFPAPADSISPRTLRVALAAYVRSLVALNAPFDRAVRGDTAAMSASARRGFNLFMGRARCGTCHFAPLFNGTAPPMFNGSEPEIIGVPSQAVASHATLDRDRGRGAIDRIEGHDYAFKTPTLRNIALTAPYMHNGVYRTLDAVIDFYDRGGGGRIGAHVATQTLQDRPMHFTGQERLDLRAFLESLTDTVVARH